MFASHRLRTTQQSVLYIAPLKSLAEEKFREWTQKDHHFSDLPVCKLTGDSSTDDHEKLSRARIIILTPEMFAFRVRQKNSKKSQFLTNVGCVVVDEAHLMGVQNRGPHIEVALTTLLSEQKGVRIVFLSATMPNIQEFCCWIGNLTETDVVLLESYYRPCPLHVHYLTYKSNRKKYEKKFEAILDLVKAYEHDKFLVFFHSKTEGRFFERYLQDHDVECGFHNADQQKAKRHRLENDFRDGNLRVLLATSTLAWGVNLPARRVVIVDVTRANTPIENYDLFQMAGRAGRPKYDPQGDVYYVIPQKEKTKLENKLETSPPIQSMLVHEVDKQLKVLAFHVLGLISTNRCHTEADLVNFLQNTFGGYRDQICLDDIRQVVQSLQKIACLKTGEKLSVTSLGRLASDYYLSPYDVFDLRNNLRKIFDHRCESIDPLVCVALAKIDTNYSFHPNKREIAASENFRLLLAKKYGLHLEQGIAVVAFAYQTLLNGTRSESLTNIQNQIRKDIGRLLQPMQRVRLSSNQKSASKFVTDLQLRLQYGVANELLDLVKLPGIGKVRAQKLRREKTDLKKITKLSDERLSSLLGIKNTEKINGIRQRAQEIIHEDTRS